jgi:membrane-bound lytic murein transglycosylase B
MRRFRVAIAATVLGAAIAAQGAVAQTSTDPAVPPETTTPEESAPPPASIVVSPPPRAPKPKPAPKPQKPIKTTPTKKGGEKNEEGVKPTEPIEPAPAPQACGPTGIPPTLIPIYQSASERYGLGVAGPSILAAINEIESGFGQNLGPSSAGALGWMQFMPSTWDAYGVDADGDGVKDPNDPEDAIFAAARYLRASGMPDDPEGAVFSYNHADWYVADVMARAACFSGIGSGAIGDLSLIPQRQELVCSPAPGARESIPEAYLTAFQNAATQYGLGEDGVWALAAVARLESNYGGGMSPEELQTSGPLGISDENWERFAVDGDGDGKAKRESPADSAATVARMIWASGTLRAGLFQHNHAIWYVDAVLEEADGLAGKCNAHTVAYSVMLPGPTSLPIHWENLTLSNSMEMVDLQSGVIDPRVIGLLAALTQDHQVTVSALRSDHGQYTTSGNVSNHFFGRAVDIAAIDGVPCTNTDPNGTCGTIARSLGALPPGQKPTELIYCFDPDGPASPDGFAQADHCDHIHAGFDG